MREQERIRQQRYRTTHPQTVSEQRRRYRQRIRLDVLQAYGGRCYVCGEDDLDLLELDHLHGDGNAHRNEIFNHGHASPGGWMFYLRLRQAGYPSGLGCICKDCHDAKHGRTKERARCAPGQDQGRLYEHLDRVPF